MRMQGVSSLNPADKRHVQVESKKFIANGQLFMGVGYMSWGIG